MKQAAEFAENLVQKSLSSNVMQNKETLNQKSEELCGVEVPSCIPVLFALFLNFIAQVPVGHPGEIDEIFDAISYSKGASVIRMLHDYVGDVPTKNNLWLLVPLPNRIQEFVGYPYLQFMSSWFLAFNPWEWLASNFLSYTFNSESQTKVF